MGSCGCSSRNSSAMSDEDEQTDELLALTSIYDDSVFTSQRNDEQLWTGTLKASVGVPQLFRVQQAGQG